jgi:hypothetical protein
MSERHFGSLFEGYCEGLRTSERALIVKINDDKAQLALSPAFIVSKPFRWHSQRP